MREIYSQIGLLVMFAVVAAAFRWGGPRERATGALVAIGWIALLAAQALLHKADPWRLLAAMDVVVFVVLLRITWRRTPGWAVFALMCQAVALGVHVIRALSLAMSTWTYMTALAISSYGVLACLAWGVWVARQRRRSGIHS